MDEIFGGLIVAAIVIAIVYFVVVYILLPLVSIILGVGLCFGGFFAIKNYALAFKEVVVDSNRT